MGMMKCEISTYLLKMGICCLEDVAKQHGSVNARFQNKQASREGSRGLGGGGGEAEGLCILLTLILVLMFSPSLAL